jgi:hypothetical protein
MKRLITVALCALAFAPLPAHAVELYWDPVVTPTRPLVLVQPTPVVYTTPTVTTTTNVDLVINTPAPAQPTTQRDAYDTHGLVIAGAGMGAMFFFGDGLTGTAASYRLHAGLAVGQGEFAVRADLMPDALRLAGGNPAAVYALGASFNYRFLPEAMLHPVAGIGVETVILDPHATDGGAAFGVTARVGLELAYPIDSGALALGIDVEAHHLIGQDVIFPEATGNMLGVSAYVDWRF